MPRHRRTTVGPYWIRTSTGHPSWTFFPTQTEDPHPCEYVETWADVIRVKSTIGDVGGTDGEGVVISCWVHATDVSTHVSDGRRYNETNDTSMEESLRRQMRWIRRFTEGADGRNGDRTTVFDTC